MTPALMSTLREQAAIDRYEHPGTYTAKTRAYATQATWDAWVHLIAGRFKEAREHLQLASDLLAGFEEPKHADGCRCPKCDPAYNDPSVDEAGRETDAHYYWRRELGKACARHAEGGAR